MKKCWEGVVSVFLLSTAFQCGRAAIFTGCPHERPVREEERLAGEWEKTRKIQAESQEAVRVAYEKIADHEQRKENSGHYARRLKGKIDRLEKELAGMKAKQSESV